MRPIKSPPKYRIKSFNGEFTIQKLVRVTVKAKTFWEFLYYGLYRVESHYHILTDRENIFKPFVEANPITEKFKSLKEAKKRLKKIILQCEVKYHNI